MSMEFTLLSAAEYDQILYGHMTPDIAAAYLRDDRLALRNFADILRQMYPSPDIVSRLTDSFLSGNRTQNPQSVARKVRNWLSGKNQPSSRADLFRIAFALTLSEPQLDYLLGFCTDYGIQYRCGYDVVFTWFLRNGCKYSDAETFYGSLPPAGELNQLIPEVTSRLTHELQNEFQMIQTVDELRACYLKNRNRFGTLHLRAYYYFDQYFNQLVHPTPFWGSEEEPDYSTEKVMDTYLSMQMPSGKKRSNYTLIQKLLKQGWPNATSIKNIRNHKEDVSRKLLLLLYVATENGINDQYQEIDEEYMTLEERVEDHWWTLNAMLGDCGMASLDPRNPTDWLILYAVSSDCDEPMSERLEQVIANVFSTTK